MNDSHRYLIDQVDSAMSLWSLRDQIESYDADFIWMSNRNKCDGRETGAHNNIIFAQPVKYGSSVI